LIRLLGIAPSRPIRIRGYSPNAPLGTPQTVELSFVLTLLLYVLAPLD